MDRGSRRIEIFCKKTLKCTVYFISLPNIMDIVSFGSKESLQSLKTVGCSNEYCYILENNGNCNNTHANYRLVQ